MYLIYIYIRIEVSKSRSYYKDEKDKYFRNLKEEGRTGAKQWFLITLKICQEESSQCFFFFFKSWPEAGAQKQKCLKFGSSQLVSRLLFLLWVCFYKPKHCTHFEFYFSFELGVERFLLP